MTDENNTTANQIGIPTEDGVKNVDSEMLTQYKNEAMGYLLEEDNQKGRFKGVVKTMSEVMDIKKPVISKWLKARFAEKMKALSQEADTMEALDAAVEPQDE